MAAYLYRLGRASFRRRRIVLGAWLALLAIAGTLALTLGGSTSSTFTVPGTEAQKAKDYINAVLPEQKLGTGEVVFASGTHDGINATSARVAVSQAMSRIATLPGIAAAPDPYSSSQISPDGQVALGSVTFGQSADHISGSELDAVKTAAEPARAAGLTVAFGGDAYSVSGQTGDEDAAGLLIAAIVLAVTLGAVVAASLPLLTAVVGVGITMALLLVLAAGTDLISTAPVLALMVGLAVGIDYALFLISRYRRNLSEGVKYEEAAARANATAGSAVVFAGLTVVVALAGLALTGVPFLTQMGLAASASVAIAVLVAVTLVPALLGFAGAHIDSLVVWRRAIRPSRGRPIGRRWAALVVRRPVPVLILGLVGLGVLSVPATDLQLGLPSAGSQAVGTQARTANDLISEHFGPGTNAPLVVTVTTAGTDPAAAAGRVVTELSRLSGVQAVTPASVDQPHRLALVTVIPRTGPDDAATTALVNTIRAERTHLQDVANAQIAVTGQTAANIDVSAKLSAALPPFIAAIVAVAALLLTLAFRSILVPLKAVAGFLLSIAASLGVVVAVSQWGWLADFFGAPSTGPVVSFVPILLISVLFGLSMDYELFLVSGMKEEHASGAPAQQAVISGTSNGARVVTAAALIMFSVFGSFVTGNDPVIQPIGFALAVGVLLDAFIVRMALVPAAMALFATSAWRLPRALDRRLPHVDMEGHHLMASLAQQRASEDAPLPGRDRSPASPA